MGVARHRACKCRYLYILCVYHNQAISCISYNQPNVRAIMTSYVIKMLLYMDPI